MSRRVVNPVAYDSQFTIDILPVDLGGTGVASKADAKTSFTFLTTDDINAPNGIPGLDANGRLPDAVVPTSLTAATSVKLSGPQSLIAGTTGTYTISDYDSFTTYTINTNNGAITRNEATITYTPSTAGAAVVTVNGKAFNITATAGIVNKPSITSPASSATDISIFPTLTSSAFSYTGATQTHKQIQWVVSRNADFSNAYTQNVNAGSNSHTVTAPLAYNTIYYAKIRHSNTLDEWSEWSDVITFTTVTGIGWFTSSASFAFSTQIRGLTTDANGNIYAAGSHNSGQWDAKPYIAKFSPDGTLIWHRTLYVPATGNFYGIYLIDNSLYAVGDCNTDGSDLPYITKWSTDGDVVWQRIMIVSVYGYINSITKDSTGNIYLAGYYLNEQYEASPLIVSFTSAGAKVWEKIINMPYNGYNLYITTSSTDDLYVVGYHDDAFYIPSAHLTKISVYGNVLWQRKITVYDSGFSGATTDADGNLYIVGNVDAPVTGIQSPYLVKVLPNGNIVWQRTITLDNFSGSLISVSIDSTGAIYTSGMINDSIGRIFIGKWTSSGDLVRQHTIRTIGDGLGSFIIDDSNDNTYVAGHYRTGPTHNTNAQPYLMKLPLNSMIQDGVLSGTGLTYVEIVTTNYTVSTYNYTFIESSFVPGDVASTLHIPTYAEAILNQAYLFSTY